MSWMLLNTLSKNYILREHWRPAVGYTIEDLTAFQEANQSKWEIVIYSEPNYFRTTRVLSGAQV